MFSNVVKGQIADLNISGTSRCVCPRLRMVQNASSRLISVAALEDITRSDTTHDVGESSCTFMLLLA